MKLKYPRLSCENDKRIKICESEVKGILKLYKDGMMIKDIAKKHNVDYNTILRRINPKSYQKQLANFRVFSRKKYASDPKYRESQQKDVNKYIKKRRDTDPKFKKYHNELVRNGA